MHGIMYEYSRTSALFSKNHRRQMGEFMNPLGDPRQKIRNKD